MSLIPLTEELSKEILNSLHKREKHIEETYPKLVEECPYETRLAVTAQVFKAIGDHLEEGGTFRYLIYDRLRFNTDAYYPLYCAGGMNISNAIFDLQLLTNKKEENNN